MTTVTHAHPRLTRQLEQTALQQPNPNRPTHPCTSFLKDFVDPIHPDSGPASFHTFVSEWLESVGPDREKRCRSVCHLHHSDAGPISTQVTESAPGTGCARDADGFPVPPSPASTVSRLYQATEDSASSTTRVRRPSYRQNNLSSNNIDIRHANTKLPNHVSTYVETIWAERDSPSPSSEQINGYLDRMEDL